jgi:dTDP-D-glucose 4,6-dehydratase
MPSGFKVWTTGELVNASDFNNYIQEQVIMTFADSSARDTAVSSPEEGMFCFLADTNTLQFYNGSSWASFIGEGDITGVTITTDATSGLSGGATATSGAFSSTLVIAPNSATSATVASGDIVLIGDVDDSNAVKKTTVGDIVALAPSGVSLGLVLALS